MTGPTKLATTYFPRTNRFTTERKKQILDIVSPLVDKNLTFFPTFSKFVDSTQYLDNHNWQLKYFDNVDSYSIYEKSIAQQGKQPAKVQVLTSYTKVNCNLESALRSIAADTSEAYLAMEKFLFGGVNTAKVIEEVQPRTKEHSDQYTALKWLLFGNRNQEDFTLIETMGIREGNPKMGESRFGYRLIQSMDLQEYPSLEKTHGVKRGRLNYYMMKIIQTGEPNIVELHVSVQIPYDDVVARRRLSPLFNSYLQATKYKCHIEHHFCLQTSKLKKKTKKSSVCEICTKSFNLVIRRRYMCCHCKKHICSSCSDGRMKITNEVFKKNKNYRYVLCFRCKNTMNDSNLKAQYEGCSTAVLQSNRSEANNTSSSSFDETRSLVSVKKSSEHTPKSKEYLLFDTTTFISTPKQLFAENNSSHPTKDSDRATVLVDDAMLFKLSQSSYGSSFDSTSSNFDSEHWNPIADRSLY